MTSAADDPKIKAQKKRAASKRPRRRPADERIHHVIQIENWKLDYSFGIDIDRSRAVKYSDHRHLMLEGPIVEPAKITAKRGKVLCFPQAALIGLERPWISPTNERAPSVGSVYYRGKDYTASLTFPGDMLPIVVQLLIAGKYRHLTFDASSIGHEILRFTFTNIDGDPDHRLSLVPR